MSRRALFLFVVLSVLWGLPYLLIKVAVAEVAVPVVVFARVLLGAAILLPFAMRGGQLASVSQFWRPLTAFSILEFMLPWGLVSHAETRMTSSTAGLLMATIPILVLGIERLAGPAEPLGLRRAAGLALGFCGVFVLAMPDLGSGPWAVVEVLLAALSYAAAAVVAARSLTTAPALPMVVWCLTLAAVIYLPAAIVTWPTAMPSKETIAALAGLAGACTAVALLCFFALIREVGAARASVVTYANPVVAVVAGVLLLNEPLTPSMVGALLLIAGGSALATAAVRTNTERILYRLPTSKEMP